MTEIVIFFVSITIAVENHKSYLYCGLLRRQKNFLFIVRCLVEKKGTCLVNTTPSEGLSDYALGMPKFFMVPLTFDSYSWYQEMLAKEPVYFDSTRDAWLVFGYEDVQRILRDTQTFSSRVALGQENGPDGSIILMDPPRHRQLRSLVSQAFTPQRIAQLAPRIREIVNDLLDQVVAQGTMDVVDDLAFPLPATVIAEMLGVPSSDREQFREWVYKILGTDVDAGLIGTQNMAAYCLGIMAQRRQEPREDLISLLLAAEVDGEHLSEMDIVSFFLLMLVAGHETTTNLLANTFVCFDEYPAVIQELIAEPALIPNAVEEVLRYRSPVHLQFRITTVDTVVGGKEIKAGQFVLLILAGANLDEAQFPNATTFDIHRTTNRHMGFGYGIHFCLGAPLARLEAQIVLEIMLKRLSNIRSVPGVPLELKPMFNIYALKHVPIAFG